MIIYENKTHKILRASHRHPGIDSAIDVALTSGDVIVGHVIGKNAASGADCFGGAPLTISCVLPGDRLAILYTFAWRWSEIGQRMMLGWWHGDSEWDVLCVQEYGPVMEAV